MKLLTAGESHGKCLVGILEGLPSGVKISKEYIDGELRRRQGGYGRGGRMKIESDSVTLLSGIRGGLTMGSPVSFMIENKDYENWAETMDCETGDVTKKKLTAVRPGHADLSGMLKYGFTDARNVLERASARETAARVAAGAICRQALYEAGITITGRVLGIGGESREDNIKAAIDQARREGDTLGGNAEITIKGMPVGVGSYVQYDRKLDAKLAMHMMSIQSVKAVGIGLGEQFGSLKGSTAHDEIFSGGRKTNRAGGIEGGMSNGEDIIIRVTFKPIPTLMKGLATVDAETKQSVRAASERSDVCAVEAAAVVAENVAAFAVLDCLLETFGGDTMSEVCGRIEIRKKS